MAGRLSTKAVLAALYVGLLAGIAACGNDDGSDAPVSIPAVDANELRRGNSGEPGTLDPHRVSSSPEGVIINDLFVGLMTHDRGGRVIPGMASSVDVSEDGLVWTFGLRESLKWSDGEPLTSEDFVYSFRRSLDPDTASPSASRLYPIKNARAVNAGEMPPSALGVGAPDDNTVQFTLEKPTPYFDRLLISASAMPVPRHAIESFGDSWSRPPNAVSNGAFVLKDWTPRVQVRAEKNPYFYEQETVSLLAVKYIPTEDLGTQLRRFRAGEIDLGLNFPPSQYDWVVENLSDSVRIFPILGTYYYAINLSRPQFNDVRVRQALSMAIDRDIITTRLMRSGEVPAYGFVAPGFEGYPEQQLPDYARLSMDERQTLARELLDDAGFNKSQPLTVDLGYNMTEEHQSIAVAVAGMWGAIGVDVNLLNAETRTHVNNLVIGEFDIGRAAMFALYDDPSSFLTAFTEGDEANNYSGYSNPEFERLLREANSTFDQAERAVLLKQAESLALNEYAVIPIYYYVSKRLVSTRLSGWQDNPVGAHLSRYLSVSAQ